jgi:ribonucleoside-diphosphate reductase alpha chain
MSARQRLPNRRRSEVVCFDHEGHRFRGSISRFADGRIAEVFLHTEKPDTGVAVVGHDLAVAASLALQHGCPVDTLRRALSRLSNGDAAGPLGALLDIVEEER